MIKAKAVFVWLYENQANEPTLIVRGKGPLAEGPVAGSEVEIAEEGIVGAVVPGVGFMPCVSLETDTEQHRGSFDMCDAIARRAAKDVGRKIELVRFGDMGREHVSWYNPE